MVYEIHMIKRHYLLSIVGIFLVSQVFPVSAVVGNWRTIDDETGKTKSIVQITESLSGEIQGRVIEILHSNRGPNPLCDNCPGERAGKPVKGMVILWGMSASGDDQWKGGQIIDPTKGKIYKAKLKLREDGKLEVRGFIGFSLIGRTQVWEPDS